MKFCENCGAKLADDVVFCEECGTKQVEIEEIKNINLQEIVEEPSVAVVKQAGTESKVSGKPVAVDKQQGGLKLISALVIAFPPILEEVVDIFPDFWGVVLGIVFMIAVLTWMWTKSGWNQGIKIAIVVAYMLTCFM